ncbi:MAG: quinoprotein relay system zinc metallohydrolase 2 [Burkholderiales bacterium]
MMCSLLRAGLFLLAALAAGAAVAGDFTLNEIAPGVYVHNGVQEESSPHNLGDIANIGFIVGTQCVAAIDSGGSIVVGQRLRQAVKNATRVPICYVINTHVHPDHIFGNAAFSSDKPVFVGHENLPQAMAARGGNYLRALTRDVGRATAGTEVVLPTLTVKDTLELDLGGRKLMLKAWRTAHTDNDLSVFDDQTQTLWLADLLFIGHVPVVDGSLRGWLVTLDELRKMQPRHIVPGHGKVDAQWPQALQPEADYLKLLLSEVRLALRQKRTLQQAVDSVGLTARGEWLLFDAFHKRNVTAAYSELEWED